MNRREKGFSLLEIIVAFAVVAISLSVYVEAHGRSSRNMSRSSDYLEAVSLSESLLLRATVDHTIATGQSGNGFVWEVLRSPYKGLDIAAPRYTPTELTVTVKWGRLTAKELELKTVYLADDES